jgi:hypothetical protein
VLNENLFILHERERGGVTVKNEDTCHATFKFAKYARGLHYLVVNVDWRKGLIREVKDMTLFEMMQ